MATAKKYTKTAINTNLTLEPNINTSKDAKILKHYLKLFTVNPHLKIHCQQKIGCAINQK
jgi:hypothetical protein